VIVRFVNIGEIVDLHCLSSLFQIRIKPVNWVYSSILLLQVRGGKSVALYA